MDIDTGTEELLCDLSDRVLTVTLNRPQARNALSMELMFAFRRILAEYGDHPDVGALVVTGAGGAFCAGADLAADSASTSLSLNAMHPVSAAALALHEVSKPTIAKVRGVAAGAGLNMALLCDLLVASEDARFAGSTIRRSRC